MWGWFGAGLWSGLIGVAGAADHVVCTQEQIDAGTTAGCSLTIQDAVDAAVSGDAVVLLQGTYREAGVRVDKDLSIGPKVEGVVATLVPDLSAEIPVFTFDNGAAATLRRVAFAPSGTRAVVVQGGADLVASTLYVASQGLSQEGSAILVESGSLRLSRSILDDNHAVIRGGHVAIEGGDVTLRTSVFLEGFAQKGGAVSIQGTSGRASLKANDVEFVSNRARDAGGAVWIGEEADVWVEGSYLYDNAADLGGALAMEGTLSTLKVGWTSLNGNEGLQGGGIGVTGGATLLRQSWLDYNQSEGRGGGLLVTGGASAEVRHTEFCLNGAYRSGGGVFYAPTADEPVRWHHVRFIENTAERGGGLTVRASGLTIRHANFLGNAADTAGGAIYSNDAPVISLKSSLVAYNTFGGGLSGDAEWTDSDHNAMWDNGGRDAPGSFGSYLSADPLLVAYSRDGDCDNDQDWPSLWSPLRNAAPGWEWDSTRGDIGAYGNLYYHHWVWETDHDGDGWYLIQDCDDQDADVHIRATEVWYDGIDQNCDGRSDFDQDKDGFDSAEYGGEDCDDERRHIHPGAVDVPWNGVDEDCSGADLSDVDGDGYDGLAAGGTDCDDENAEVHPGLVDRTHRRDADCDGYRDIRRSLQIGCETTGGTPGPWWLTLGLLVRRR